MFRLIDKYCLLDRVGGDLQSLWGVGSLSILDLDRAKGMRGRKESGCDADAVGLRTDI